MKRKQAFDDKTPLKHHCSVFESGNIIESILFGVDCMNVQWTTMKAETKWLRVCGVLCDLAKYGKDEAEFELYSYLVNAIDAYNTEHQADKIEMEMAFVIISELKRNIYKPLEQFGLDLEALSSGWKDMTLQKLRSSVNRAASLKLAMNGIYPNQGTVLGKNMSSKAKFHFMKMFLEHRDTYASLTVDSMIKDVSEDKAMYLSYILHNKKNSPYGDKPCDIKASEDENIEIFREALKKNPRDLYKNALINVLFGMNHIPSDIVDVIFESASWILYFRKNHTSFFIRSANLPEERKKILLD